MKWNYRVVKTKLGYSVYEVFYNEQGEPIATTEKPILDFFCESIDAVKYELEVIKEACDFPSIDEADIGSKNKSN